MEYSEARRLDVVSIGRVAVDFYGEQFGCDLEDISTFRKLLGGCPANIAVGAARLGLKVAMVSRVGSEHMGRFVLQALRDGGIDTTQCKVDSQRMTAMAVLCVKDKETFPLVYYRENCADLALSAEDVSEEIISSARSVVVTGTLCATPENSSACHAAIELARRHSTKVVFDIDYRPVLWGLTKRDMGEMRYVSSKRVTEALQKVISNCDLIVGTEEEVHIAGGIGDTLEALRKLRDLTAATIVLKLGAKGCAVFERDIPDSLEEAFVVPGFPADVLNVLGAGDAFLAGLLRGWLRGENWKRSCEFANACGAIVVSRNSCAPATPYWDELLEFIRTRGEIALRRPHEFARMHRAIPRLMRNEWLSIVDFQGAANDVAAALSGSVPESFADLSDKKRRHGVIIDASSRNNQVLPAQAPGAWVGRRVRLEVGKPVDVDLDVIKSWPQSDALLVSINVIEATELSVVLTSLQTFHELCRGQERDFVLELSGAAAVVFHQGLSRLSAELLRLNIHPDWWKLPLASSNSENWRGAVETITAADRYTRVILDATADTVDAVEFLNSEFAGGISMPSEILSTSNSR